MKPQVVYATKSDYELWERDILTGLKPSLFKLSCRSTQKKDRKSSRTTHKMNSNYTRSAESSTKLMVKHKVILVLDLQIDSEKKTEEPKFMSELSKAEAQNLTESKISIWHTGNKKLDEVKLGYNPEKKQFLYPAIDFGGITNYRIVLDNKPDFLAPGYNIDLSGPAPAKTTSEILNNWLKLSKLTNLNLDMQHKLYDGLKKVLNSLIKTDHPSVAIRFVKLPDEDRVISPAAAIYIKTGRYYLRNYGGSDKQYAISINPMVGAYNRTGQKLFLGVSENYITPNLNQQNLILEYHKK